MRYRAHRLFCMEKSSMAGTYLYEMLPVVLRREECLR